VFLSALFGLPFADHDGLVVFSQHTGRTQLPTQSAREAWVIAGRRGGKSRIAALCGTLMRLAARSYEMF
jgi:hypothetical protein